MKTKLEIGDVIYKCFASAPQYKYTIDRVTKTQAIAGNVRFKRKYPGYIKEVGRREYSIHHYALATPELDQAYADKKAKSWLEKNYHRFTPEQIREIYTKYKYALTPKK